MTAADLIERPYLILHKVRGLPAFDIAIPLKIGSEDGWIIPTSGHRAYPYEVIPLDELRHDGTGWTVTMDWLDWVKKVKVPNRDVPDHYSVNDHKRAPSTPTETLSLSEIGL